MVAVTIVVLSRGSRLVSGNADLMAAGLRNEVTWEGRAGQVAAQQQLGSRRRTFPRERFLRLSGPIRLRDVG